jgi:hypothetical protein
MNRRSWMQFSTRFLLSAVVLSALPFWWIRRRMVAARIQEEAIRRLESLGGSVGYAHEWDDDKDRYSGSRHPGTPFLRAVLGDHFFLTPNVILFSDFNGDQRHLEPISRLSTVRHLGIVASAVDDGIVPIIQPLNRIEYLSLYGTQITDVGLEQLASLRSLRSIVVTNTKVTEAGRQRFASLCPQCVIYFEDNATETNAATLEQPPNQAVNPSWWLRPTFWRS